MKLSPNVKLNTCNCIKNIDDINVTASMSIKNDNFSKNNKIVSFYSNNSRKNNKIKTLF